MKNYERLTDEQGQELGRRLSHNKYWPTYFDVDEAVRELLRGQEIKTPKIDLMAEAKKHGPVMPKTEGERKEFIEATARRCFPEADESFIKGIIENCPSDIYYQGYYDRTCACCSGGEIHGEPCSNFGHRHYLKVLPGAKCPMVSCVMIIDSCGKYGGQNV